MRCEELQDEGDIHLVRSDQAADRGHPSELIHSFPPICDGNARILLLGSMPSRASLEARQYYAHPRNTFWRIIAHLLGFRSDLPYPERLDRLKSRGIALWDVLHSCARQGSLDAAIEEASIVPNAVGELLGEHPGIRRVYFNGGKAEQAFRRYVAPTLPFEARHLRCVRLPSTSPAHAGRSFEQKLAAWRVVIDPD